MTQNNKTALRALLTLLLAVTVVPAWADIVVLDARAELSASEPRSVAVYFMLRNETAHELELMKVESARAGRVELKQLSYDADNRPHVWPVAKFEIPPGGSIRLMRAGRFFRVSELDAKLRVGDRLPLTLVFEDEPPLTLDLTLEAAPRK
jgi:copper(I)-binding protein